MNEPPYVGCYGGMGTAESGRAMKNNETKFWRTSDGATIKGSWGKLMSLFGYNNGADVFIQLHTSDTPDDDTILAVLPARGKDAFALDVPVVGMDFPALYVFQSSTALTFSEVTENAIGFTTVLS